MRLAWETRSAIRVFRSRPIRRLSSSSGERSLTIEQARGSPRFLAINARISVSPPMRWFSPGDAGAAWQLMRLLRCGSRTSAESSRTLDHRASRSQSPFLMGSHWRTKKAYSGRLLFVSVENRLLPEADPLVQAQDVAAALAAAQRKVQTLGGDPRRFVLMGHSAGAHLVALL